jgi:hypothetical protein
MVGVGVSVGVEVIVGLGVIVGVWVTVLVTVAEAVAVHSAAISVWLSAVRACWKRSIGPQAASKRVITNKTPLILINFLVRVIS